MKSASIGLSSLILGSLLAAGCGSSAQDAAVKLQPLADCGSVQLAIRQMALDEMNQKLDEQLDRALMAPGEGCSHYWGGERDGAYNSAPPTSGQSSPGGSGASAKSGGASQVSTTNNQVAGVDEADFIKNDNKYIYVVSGSSFRIIKAWPATSAKEIAKVALDGTPRKLFVAGDRALVYASVKASGAAAKKSSSSYRRGECTYGYNCSFTGDGNPTQITVLDIKDRAAPKVVRVLKLSGSYVNARRVGNAVFTVLSSPGISFPGLSYRPKAYNCSAKQPIEEILTLFENLRAANRKLILDQVITDWLPSVQDKVLAGSNTGSSSQVLAGCKGFYKSAMSDGGQFTTLLGLDISRETPATASTIVSLPGAVYASGEALYISVPRQQRSGRGWYRNMSNVDEASTVHRFALSHTRAAARYTGSGVVKGRVLNQFSMDEHEGHLRIATTTGRLPSAKVHSTLSVLKQRGARLDTVGVVDRLAPKEDIRSVRFDGERAYMVTFKKTDPLFVFDLSQPTAPRVLSELKIPGFSTYMQMMDKTHLLTIGYDANDKGSFAWFTGVMFQIFDVSNPYNPVRTHKQVIGTRGSSSAALTNHLAFNYFGAKNLLAVPMTVCDGSSGGGSYGKQMSFSGLMVFDVKATSGFKLRGKVTHPAGSGVTCSNWWTRANSQVQRSVIMDDYVFSVSHELIKVNHLDKLSKDLGKLPIK